MVYITFDPIDAMNWWENEPQSTILTDDGLYCVGMNLMPSAVFLSWRIISPEELTIIIQEDVC